MKIRKILALAMVLTMILGLSATAAEASSTDSKSETEAASYGEAEFTFSYASNEPVESLRYVHIEKPFLDYITEKSGGRIQFVEYPSGTLGTTGTILKSIKDGLIDVGIDAPTFYPGSYPYFEFFGTPNANPGETFEEKQKNIDEFTEKYVAPELEPVAHVLADYVTLNTYVIGNKEINGPEDFEQQNVMTSANYFGMYTAMGATTTGVNYSEAYEDLKLGVIDMCQAGYYLIKGFRFNEVTKYAYHIPNVVSNSVLFISNERYNALPDDLKQIVDEAGRMVETEFNTNYIKACEEFVEGSIAEETPEFQYLELPESVQEILISVGDEMLEAKAKELTDAGLDGEGALELAKSFRK